MSLVDVDTIPALKYPLLDWRGEWFMALDSPEPFYRWPKSCKRISLPYTKSGWPSRELREKVMAGGCHLVPKYPVKFGDRAPIGPQETHAERMLREMKSTPSWRISFSQAEKILVKSFTMVQKRTFLLVKVLFSYHGEVVDNHLKRILGVDKEKSFWEKFLEDKQV